MSAPDFAAQALKLTRRYLGREEQGVLYEMALEALRAAYARGHADGMADSAKVAEDYWRHGKNVYARHAGRAVESRIRALAQLPSGEEEL